MSELEREILKYLAERSGKVSFYHLVRMFGYGPSQDLPAIVAKLKGKGLIEEGALAGAMPLLIVTPAGEGVVKQTNGSP
jgi:hypothetical protein